jgi:hypothetical protein
MPKEKKSVSTTTLSFDGFDGHSAARAIAISAGDLSIVVRNEVKKILKTNRNDILRSLNSGLQELVKRKSISTQEQKHLNEICRHLLYSIRGKEDGEEAFLAIRKIYHELLMDEGSSPTALAIASVANSAFNLEKHSPLTITPETTGAGAAIGAVIGGVIGGIVGGGFGAGFGAAIGGAAGAAIGWCNETGNGQT